MLPRHSSSGALSCVPRFPLYNGFDACLAAQTQRGGGNSLTIRHLRIYRYKSDDGRCEITETCSLVEEVFSFIKCSSASSTC